MEMQFAIRQRADDLAILTDIADQYDRRIMVRLVFRPPGGTRDCRFAEIARKPDQLLLAERLAAEKQHQMLKPRLAERSNGSRVKRN